MGAGVVMSEKSLGQIAYEAWIEAPVKAEVREGFDEIWDFVAKAVAQRCVLVCRDKIKAFASDEYATGQPLSSFGERFACKACADEIELLIGGVAS